MTWTPARCARDGLDAHRPAMLVIVAHYHDLPDWPASLPGCWCPGIHRPANAEATLVCSSRAGFSARAWLRSSSSAKSIMPPRSQASRVDTNHRFRDRSPQLRHAAPAARPSGRLGRLTRPAFFRLGFHDALDESLLVLAPDLKFSGSFASCQCWRSRRSRPTSGEPSRAATRSARASQPQPVGEVTADAVRPSASISQTPGRRLQGRAGFRAAPSPLHAAGRSGLRGYV